MQKPRSLAIERRGKVSDPIGGGRVWESRRGRRWKSEEGRRRVDVPETEPVPNQESNASSAKKRAQAQTLEMCEIDRQDWRTKRRERSTHHIPFPLSPHSLLRLRSSTRQPHFLPADSYARVSRIFVLIASTASYSEEGRADEERRRNSNSWAFDFNDLLSSAMRARAVSEENFNGRMSVVGRKDVEEREGDLDGDSSTEKRDKALWSCPPGTTPTEEEGGGRIDAKTRIEGLGGRSTFCDGWMIERSRHSKRAGEDSVVEFRLVLDDFLEIVDNCSSVPESRWEEDVVSSSSSTTSKTNAKAVVGRAHTTTSILAQTDGKAAKSSAPSIFTLNADSPQDLDHLGGALGESSKCAAEFGERGVWKGVRKRWKRALIMDLSQKSLARTDDLHPCVESYASSVKLANSLRLRSKLLIRSFIRTASSHGWNPPLHLGAREHHDHGLNLRKTLRNAFEESKIHREEKLTNSSRPTSGFHFISWCRHLSEREYNAMEKLEIWTPFIHDTDFIAHHAFRRGTRTPPTNSFRSQNPSSLNSLSHRSVISPGKTSNHSFSLSFKTSAPELISDDSELSKLEGERNILEVG
ncbi:hypothetical protein SCHPADRAFT_894287 [Schizopora paradoxa]|uniref:Uncharacterized protein n=1 Tax=Schizopora paradoxa TaxID=27342 RepID=A0A0H2RSQ3_9AGAM|nr:hypothetical protein SCHPADRAFT_894287 [Schizopora paradoxa]